MIRYLAAALTVCSFIVLGGTAGAQDTTAPNITFDAPANGVDLGTVTDDPDLFSRSKVTITGTASDGTRVKEVQYRVERSRRWRRATVINTGTTAGQGGGAGVENYAWSVRVKMNRKTSRRVYVRAFDEAGNESDILGRKVMRGRR